MRNISMIMLGAVLLGFGLPECLSGPVSEIRDSWTTLAKGDFHAFLDAFSERENATPWLQLTVREDPSMGQTNAKELASILLQRLEQYTTSLPELSSGDGEAVSRTVAQLQDMRDQMVSKGGYVNFVLADMINRVVFSCLTKQIIDARRVDPRVQAQIDRAHRFKIPMSSWRQMIEAETGQPIRMNLPQDDENPWPGVFALMTNTAGVAGTEMGLESGRVSSRKDLLHECNVPLLIGAYMKTDELIHRSLPLLALYVKTNPDFSASDDYGQMKAVLSSIAPKENIGSDMSPYKISSLGAIPRLLQAHKYGKLDQMAGIANNTGAPFRLGVDDEIRDWLEKIDSVKQQIALMEGMKPDDDISNSMIEEFIRRKMPIPPDGGEYRVGKVNEKPYYVRPDGQIIRMESSPRAAPAPVP